MEWCIILAIAIVIPLCIAVAAIADRHSDSNNDDYWEW